MLRALMVDLAIKTGLPREARVVVFNDVAQRIVDQLRGQHPTYVFTWEDRKGRRRRFILTHKTARITTHYSAPEIGNLVAAVNRIADNPVPPLPSNTQIWHRSRLAYRR